MDTTYLTVADFLRALGNALAESSRGQKMDLVRLIDRASVAVREGPRSDGPLHALIDELEEMSPHTAAPAASDTRLSYPGQHQATKPPGWNPDQN